MGCEGDKYNYTGLHHNEILVSRKKEAERQQISDADCRIGYLAESRLKREAERQQISDADCRIGYLAESRLKRKVENKSRKQAEEDQDLRDREEEYIKTQPPQGKEVVISRLTGDKQNIHNKFS